MKIDIDANGCDQRLSMRIELTLEEMKFLRDKERETWARILKPIGRASVEADRLAQIT